MLAKHLERLVQESKVFDLGMDYFTGMPHHPNQPPFAFTLLKKHGDITLEKEKISFSNDLFTMGGHTGRHLDAKAHVARDNVVAGGIDISDLQDYQQGLKALSIDKTPPILKKGVLLDIPASLHLEILPHDFGIGSREIETALEFEGVQIGRGDVVLVRTGWIRHWNDRRKYLSVDRGVPGVIEDGARFLAGKGISFTGSDTTAFERVPPHHLPCHVILLVENGIQIMEMLNLEELSESRVYEFLFVALPLKIKGGAGSPIRPIAIA
ncbi:MAG: cyclase family protein [Desulfobacterales bacterium]|nr:cyclase family protein [Desulfobacterales bacterium]